MITSVRNPRIAEARRLRRARERRATGRTTLEGPFLLEEAIAAGVTIHDVYATPDDHVVGRLCAQAGIEVTPVTSEVLGALAASVTPRGPVTVISVPDPGEARRVDSVVMWEIADPGNAGTIIRTAAAFGFQVLATRGCVDLWAPKVVRAAVGGHFRTSLVEAATADLSQLAALGLRPFVATAGVAAGTDTMARTDEPIALIVGNEAHGVPGALLDDERVEIVSIEMPGGAESLNAGVAASILMYLRMAARPSG